MFSIFGASTQLVFPSLLTYFLTFRRPVSSILTDVVFAILITSVDSPSPSKSFVSVNPLL